MPRSPRMEALYDVFLRKRPRQSRSRSVVEAILGATGEPEAAAQHHAHRAHARLRTYRHREPEHFAAALGRAFAERTDLKPIDHQAAAYVLTHSIMGVMAIQIWQDTSSVERASVHEELITMTCAYVGA